MILRRRAAFLREIRNRLDLSRGSLRTEGVLVAFCRTKASTVKIAATTIIKKDTNSIS